jgi:3-dehydroquinate dehydratase-1
MAQAQFQLADGSPKVVGSIGNREDLSGADAVRIRDCCDLVELRLDRILTESNDANAALWQHLCALPLLFTVRREDEGGARALTADQRMQWLAPALDQAAAIDIEVASIGEMSALIRDLNHRHIPWIASFHDFKQMPENTVLLDAARRARDAGACVFKAAAWLHDAVDLARLAEFQLADHGLAVATMGMGPLGAVSRLLCAQCGSALNYGYLGKTSTAPGQWNAALLRETISLLEKIRS